MRKFILTISIFVAALAACSPSAPVAPASAIEISQATILLPGNNAMGAMDMSSNLAGYMQIKNTSDSADRLIAVSTDFADAMLHESIMEGDVMKMNEVSGIDLPAGSTVVLKTGGYHIMFTNLQKDVKTGDTVNLTLKFENAGTLTIPVTIASR